MGWRLVGGGGRLAGTELSLLISYTHAFPSGRVDENEYKSESPVKLIVFLNSSWFLLYLQPQGNKTPSSSQRRNPHITAIPSHSCDTLVLLQYLTARWVHRSCADGQPTTSLHIISYRAVLAWHGMAWPLPATARARHRDDGPARRSSENGLNRELKHCSYHPLDRKLVCVYPSSTSSGYT
jgi:hypothetical protein